MITPRLNSLGQGIFRDFFTKFNSLNIYSILFNTQNVALKPDTCWKKGQVILCRIIVWDDSYWKGRNRNRY